MSNSKSYKEKFEELKNIVSSLETNPDIDELTKSVKRGAELVVECNDILKATEEDISKVLESLKDKNITVVDKQNENTEHLSKEEDSSIGDDLPF